MPLSGWGPWARLGCSRRQWRGSRVIASAPCCPHSIIFRDAILRGGTVAEIASEITSRMARCGRDARKAMLAETRCRHSDSQPRKCCKCLSRWNCTTGESSGILERTAGCRLRRSSYQLRLPRRTARRTCFRRSTTNQQSRAAGRIAHLAAPLLGQGSRELPVRS